MAVQILRICLIEMLSLRTTWLNIRNPKGFILHSSILIPNSSLSLTNLYPLTPFIYYIAPFPEKQAAYWALHNLPAAVISWM